MLTHIYITSDEIERITALTAGGNSDTDIATPTIGPKFSPKTAIAAAIPVGKAVNIPNINEWNSHLS